ncbi:hypothetical protein GCM10012275_39300 [Longimycelium tulufanense]|uniref:Uncharacterized protein n=1 Tax=Longimycelium tulufanense TaxID=907463 RepID=A0A8J3CDW5_9PSEU|nr:hypothetical protein [Longimycelium tulufanense]GGM64935.1 hypothetical protein GCM10012275_39300 [Longimycelium tulufanense]
MGEEPPGYTIGIPEVYAEIRGLSTQLTAYINRQDLAMNSVQHNLREAQRDIEELRARLDAEQARRTTTNRQVALAILTSFALPILVWFLTTK